MQTLEILLEENAYGAVRPMEVAADTPVFALLPAIVEELKLPRTDLFGNRLIYMLRYPSGGPILPEDRSLMAAGVVRGEKLALDSYVMEGSVAALLQAGQEHPQPSFYSSETIADATYFPSLGKDTSAKFPAVGYKQTRKKGRWTRRAFLVLGGAAFAAGSLSFGYAAYRKFMSDSPIISTRSTTHAPVRPAQAQATANQLTIPTMAKRVLVFSQHQQTVRSVTWSPDGNMLASGANDAQLLTWDLGGMVHVRTQQAGAIRAVAWSPNGQQLVAGVANLVMFLNPQTGAALVQPARVHTAPVTALAWSTRQPLQVVSGGLDQKAVVWNAASYIPQTVFTQHTAAIEAVSWAGDGQTVGTSSHGGVVRVWNAANGQQTHGFYMDAQLPMRALSFASASGLLAVGGDDGIVRLWNGLTCQLQGQGGFGNQCMDMPQRLHAHTGAMRTLAWSPDGRFLATGGDDGILAIWHPAKTHNSLLKVRHTAPVLAVGWSSNGNRVAAASGNTVTIWELH